MTGSREVAVRLAGGGWLMLPEPAWCIGHLDMETARADIYHQSAPLEVTVTTARGERELLAAHLEHAPFSETGTREPYASVCLADGDHYRYDPAGLRSLAAEVAVKGPQMLRTLADQLAALDDGEGGRDG